MKVKGISLGCKVNTYEIEYILSSFKKKGYTITDDEADICIINTCSVTNMSDAKSRKVINRLIRENPKAIIVVMGCMIEANKDYTNDNVNIIIGNKDKNNVVDLVEDYLKEKRQIKRLYDDFDSEFEDMFITNMEDRTRAFVKIQDGCENFCSYCIIPYTRGKCRSKDKDKVIKEVEALTNNGYQEVVLTGIHTGHYGEDSNVSFSSLLESLVKIPKLKRLRISSIEITELNDDFLNVFENNDVIVSHLHIPLQSGCDKILKAMNRKYDLDFFFKKIAEIREIRPNIAISTDVIVGFPGESEELFQTTMDTCRKLEFSKIHVFPYSERRGTKSSYMDGKLDNATKKDRARRLIELSKELEINYMKKFIGTDVEVLIEEYKDGCSFGHTGNFLYVKINHECKHNEMVTVKVKDIDYPYVIAD